MFHSLLAQVTTGLMCAVVLWALIAGRWPERVGGAACAIDWLGGAVFQDHRPRHHGQPVAFALDVAMFVVMMVLVVRCRRTWVLWAAACALLLILTHVSLMLDISFGQWTFITASYIWSLAFLLALGCGVAVEGRRPVVTLVWSG